MKIVTLSSKDSFGGAAKAAYRIHRLLLEQEIDNKFIVNSKRTKDNTVIPVSSLNKKRNYLFHLLSNLSLKRKEKERIKKWDRYLYTREDKVYIDLEISLLKNKLDTLDFDLLQLHWVGESFVNFTEFENIQVPVVWTLHDCFAFTGICSYFETCDKYKTHCGNCPFLHSGIEKDFSYEVFEQKIERYKGIDFYIVSPSKWLAREAKSSYLLRDYPITVIPNGVDTKMFFPVEKQAAKLALGIDAEKKVILFGGISVMKDTRKGGDLLLQSLTTLKETYSQKDDIELIILGSESSEYDLGFKASYLGYVDNELLMRIVYSAADVSVVSSRYENLPTVIMESMACGTPVTAFDIGGNSDMIDHLNNGYLAKPYDTDDFADGIKYCLENNHENKMGINGRDKVLNNFKIEDIAQQYINLYRNILTGKKGENTI